MANREARLSRRLCGLSPTSDEPSFRRHRSSFFGDFQPVATDALEINPTLGSPISQGEPSSVHNSNGYASVLARVLFQSDLRLILKTSLSSS